MTYRSIDYPNWPNNKVEPMRTDSKAMIGVLSNI